MELVVKKTYGQVVSFVKNAFPRLVTFTINLDEKCDFCNVPEGAQVIRYSGQKRVPGEKLAGQVNNVSVLSFLEILQMAGYELVNSFSFMRGEQRAVRFEFAAPGFIIRCPAFEAIKETQYNELFNYCAEATFNLLSIYKNPFFLDGEVTEESAISVDLNHPYLEERVPEFFFERTVPGTKDVPSEDFSLVLTR